MIRAEAASCHPRQNYGSQRLLCTCLPVVKPTSTKVLDHHEKGFRKFKCVLCTKYLHYTEYIHILGPQADKSGHAAQRRLDDGRDAPRTGPMTHHKTRRSCI